MPGVEKGSLKGGQQLLSGRSGRPPSLGQLRLERRVGIPLSAEVEKGPQEEGEAFGPQRSKALVS